ncbi:hypothetical protein Glove_421g140 [Diversispora epigaea]|uniref:Reverse transcriptase domain-containing protein n=1 Tax=Diversispora epigaea TaxID=1348612 RepID=A0A397GWD9_9GLOM|nr:hypothetical protein Glove_421g140 [Diversispora epigaea]
MVNNLHLQSKKKLSVQVSVVTYVDDTNWITSNKQNMEKILTIANEFYQINDITINKSKSYLIVINANSQTKLDDLLMGDEMLHPVTNDYPIRSLEVYVMENAIYIFNAVIIKNKTLLPTTTPNTLIHAKEVYNVCYLWDHQLQMHSNNLFNRLNDKAICKTHNMTFKLSRNINNNLLIKRGNITIEEILDDESPKPGWFRILKNKLLTDIKTRVLSAELQTTLAICKTHNMTFKLSRNINNNLLIKRGNITIEEILDDESPKPGWFRILKNKLLTDIKTRVLSAELQTTLGERYNICNWNIGKQNTNINWVAIQNNGGTYPLIGKKEKCLIMMNS